MAMVVQHNMQAMNSSRMLGITTNAQAKSTEKLSSSASPAMHRQSHLRNFLPATRSTAPLMTLQVFRFPRRCASRCVVWTGHQQTHRMVYPQFRQLKVP